MFHTHVLEIENDGRVIEVRTSARGFMSVVSDHFALTETYPIYSFESGPYVGRDQRDIAGETIEWWEREIETTEQKAYLSSISNSDT